MPLARAILTISRSAWTCTRRLRRPILRSRYDHTYWEPKSAPSRIIRVSWCVERQQDAQRSLLVLDHTTQITDVGGMQLPGLDREDNLFRLPGVAIVEVDPPVDALVRALLAFSRSSAHQPSAHH